MTLLFTGASGFLGSNIIHLLNGTYNIISVGLSPQDTYLVDIATDIPTFTEGGRHGGGGHQRPARRHGAGRELMSFFTLQVKRIPCLRRKQRSDFFLM